MENKQPCSACGGSGQLSSFNGESRFLLTVEECPLCCGTGLALEEEKKTRDVNEPRDGHEGQPLG
jgi:DnaJ-class molecular chaperone